MEISIRYEIWEIDKSHGLAPKERYLYGKYDRIVLVEPIRSFDTRDNFEGAIEEIKEKGGTYTEYTILPRIYKTS